LVWSTTCDSSLRPKKKSIALETLLVLTSSAIFADRVRLLEAHAFLDRAAQLQEALAQLFD
jgi:hypothetical protein